MRAGVRYVSTALGIGLMAVAALTALFACYKLPRVPRASALWIVLVACLLVRRSAPHPAVTAH